MRSMSAMSTSPRAREDAEQVCHRIQTGRSGAHGGSCDKIVKVLELNIIVCTLWSVGVEVGV